MALTITENFRMTAGGRAWRCFSVLHDSSTTTLTAASIDLDYIDHIVGVNTRISMVAGSTLIDISHISIAANHGSLVWASTGVGSQDITVVGW